jgi:DNA repair protein RecO (recombination protein O)
MLHSTRGIVFHQIKYSETSVIAKIYTEQFGLQSYLIRGIRGKKAKIKPGLLQHLSLLEMEVNNKETKSLQHIKELKSAYSFASIPYDMIKSSILVFLNEVFVKAVKEEEANPELFNFLFNGIQVLDMTEELNSSFHLHFLIQLTRYLGFFPKNNFSEMNNVFDLTEGEFCKITDLSEYFASLPFSGYIAELQNAQFEMNVNFSYPSTHRNELLEVIIRYYQLHIPGFGELKSHKVLKEVLH